MTGHKRAVIVGCNYPQTTSKLQGCINDAVSMYHTIVHDRFGFQPHNIVMLTDAPNGIVDTHKKPTGANIKRALGHMIDQAKSGDVLLFHFSGHGTMLHNKHDNAIVPCDFNLITDIDFRMLVNRVPHGTSFTIVSDSCHSGGLIDNEKEQIGPHDHDRSGSSHHHKARGMHHDEILQQLSSMSSLDSDDIGNQLVHLFGEDASPKYHSRDYTRNVRVHRDNGILLSGCQKNESSIDVRQGKPHGAFTTALLSVLKRHEGPISNMQLVRSTRKLLHDQGFTQHSCLYCKDVNAHHPFLEEEEEEGGGKEEDEDDDDEEEEEEEKDEEEEDDHDEEEEEEEDEEEEDDHDEEEEEEDDDEEKEEDDDDDDDDDDEEEEENSPAKSRRHHIYTT